MLKREDIVLNLEARVNGDGDGDGDGEGIGGGDAAGHGGSGEGIGGGDAATAGCSWSGEEGFGSSVKETCFFLFPFFSSAAIARVFGAIYS